MTGGDEGIGVEEAAECGIVITALEVIETQLLDSLLAIAPFFYAGIASCYPRRPGAYRSRQGVEPSLLVGRKYSMILSRRICFAIYVYAHKPNRQQ